MGGHAASLIYARTFLAFVRVASWRFCRHAEREPSPVKLPTWLPPFFVVLALQAAAIAGNTAPSSPNALRTSLNLNREWRFLPGDQAGAEAAAFDDGKWSVVGLPHSFSIPYFLAQNFYVGYGWYRKHFDVPGDAAGKRVFVEFEGVFQDAEIFVNGTRAGHHLGGYTGFSFDVTNAVKVGGDNLLSVRVNNLWNARLAPRAGEHTFSGGIYRDVHLVITDPLHVPWYGTWVTTPKVSRAAATVQVQTEVRNDSLAPKQATIESTILDPAGQRVQTLRAAQTIAAGQTALVEQLSEPMSAPQLWSPATPVLYSVQTVIYDGENPVDSYETPLGIRWFEWTPDRGFFLNGEHLYLHGSNVHQDHAGWGDAVTNAGFARDVRLVKDAGFNFIRGSHYPHDPAFAAACDRQGVLLWSENAFWGIGGFRPDGFWNSSAYPPAVQDQPEFEESVKQQLAEEIRILRNHPSIVVWSMCNEPFFTAKETLPQVRKFLKDLVDLSHRLDPTRPAAIGGAQRGDIDKIGDIAGYNGDGGRLYMNPGVANINSEYDSASATRPGRYDPDWG